MVREANGTETGDTMAIIKRLLKEDDGFIIEWIVGLVGLLFLVMAYTLFMPIDNILINTFVELGSPLAPNLWIRKTVIYSFLIFGVLCIAYPFVSAYRRTYDQGIAQQGGWR